jgi:hypothetical protein
MEPGGSVPHSKELVPRNVRVNIYVRCIVQYIDVGGASCRGIRRFKYLYIVYCEIYSNRRGFMPGNRKVKYLYTVYCEIYCSRRGFMPGNRKVKYLYKVYSSIY